MSDIRQVVLIVEDESGIRKAIERIVLSIFPGVEIIAILDEQGALEAFENNKDSISLITMDGKLDNGGYGPHVVQQLRDQGCQSVIIMCSSSDESIRKGEAAGANAGISKTYMEYELESIIRQYCVPSLG